jgi:signal transduction histidine kinase
VLATESVRGKVRGLRLAIPDGGGESAGPRSVARPLATARAVVALGALAAIFHRDSGRYSSTAALVVIAYFAYSVALLLALRMRGRFPSSRVVHALDVAWASAVMLVTAGANSPFFGLFVFAILAAAYRWGFRETLATVGAVVAILFALFLLTLERHPPWLVTGAVDADLFITRVTYVIVGGLLLGHMAETEKDLRAEASAVALLMGRIQAEKGFSATLEAVSEEMVRLFDAPRLMIVMQRTGTEQLFLWEASRSAPERPLAVGLRELDRAQAGTYLFASPSEVWHARARDKGSPDVQALDDEGRALRRAASEIPAAFVASHPFRSLLAASLDFRGEWEDRIYLFDSPARSARDLRLLRTLAGQVGPAIYNVYLHGRLRARVGAIERARAARELHDGVIQSLIGLEMHLDVLRRQAVEHPAAMAEPLARIQSLLRGEILNLRDLMVQMKPLELDPRRLQEFLVDLVERFRHETGIAAHFVSELEEIPLRPRACTEVARIVQEALANVRKHSGARNVLVRVTAGDGDWRVIIDDDGRGFPFAGRLDQSELDAARVGPVVIKERVRSIGGRLTIETSPDHGARLEIALPRPVHA